jgi:hypothetical protein
MKRILLFLLLFFSFCFSGLLFAADKELPKIVVAPLLNFDQVFVTLQQILMQIFFQYYHLLIGLLAVILFMGYIQGILEGDKMRRERAERDLVHQRDRQVRAEERRRDKNLERVRKFAEKYLYLDTSIERVVRDVQGDNWKRAAKMYENDGLRVAPKYDRMDDEEIYDNDLMDDYGIDRQEYRTVEGEEKIAEHEVVGRYQTYWDEDGNEEDSEAHKETLKEREKAFRKKERPESREKKYRNRYHEEHDDYDYDDGY